MVIRMPEVQEGSPEKAAIIAGFTEAFGSYDADTEQFASIGPAVGTEIRNRAIVAIGLASIGVLCTSRLRSATRRNHCYMASAPSRRCSTTCCSWLAFSRFWVGQPMLRLMHCS